MATRKQQDDPTVTSVSSAPEYPEGTHPVRAPAETSFAPGRNEYRDNPDKPDASSIAQIEVLPEDEG